MSQWILLALLVKHGGIILSIPIPLKIHIDVAPFHLSRIATAQQQVAQWRDKWRWRRWKSLCGDPGLPSMGHPTKKVFFPPEDDLPEKNTGSDSWFVVSSFKGSWIYQNLKHIFFNYLKWTSIFEVRIIKNHQPDLFFSLFFGIFLWVGQHNLHHHQVGQLWAGNPHGKPRFARAQNTSHHAYAQVPGSGPNSGGNQVFFL